MFHREKNKKKKKKNGMPATTVAVVAQNQMTERKNARHVYHNIFESFFLENVPLCESVRKD